MNTLSLALAALLSLSAGANTVSDEAIWFDAYSFDSDVEQAIPPAAEDAFAGVPACAILDRRYIRPFALDEAEELAAPCIAAVLAKHQASGGVRRGFLAESVDGGAAPAGLLIRTDLPLGSRGLRDLEHALARREQRLLGHPARLLRQGEPEHAPVSAIQEALGQCIMTAVVRDIRNGDDFVRVYGRCLTRNPELKIREVRGEAGLAIVVESEAERERLRSYHGFVTVNAGKGELRVMVRAEPAEAATPVLP